jgi:rRNA-processing protein FCF1
LVFHLTNETDICVARLYAKCIPTFTDCTIAELEKLGPKFRLALRVAKDPRWNRLHCDHAGTYADDCIVDRVRLLSRFRVSWFASLLLIFDSA